MRPYDSFEVDENFEICLSKFSPPFRGRRRGPTGREEFDLFTSGGGEGGGIAYASSHRRQVILVDAACSASAFIKTLE